MTDTMTLYDTVSVDDASVRRTNDGYLVADARVARSGIQMYAGSEVGMPDRQVVRVYRPPDEVFSQEAMQSYAHRPVTNGHPSQSVDAGNWRDVAVGQTGGDVMREGEYVRVPLVLMDSQAISDFESGKRELSMGYGYKLEVQDGETPEGEPYDAIQRNLRMNHLAQVSRARGGPALRIGDRRGPDEPDQAVLNLNEGGHTMADSTRKVVVDGLTIETTEQGAQALEKLQKAVTDSEKAVTDAEEKHKAEIADKDKEIAKKDGEIDEIKKQVMSDADLDKAVKERADLIGKAKTVADQDYSGKAPADIRKAAVTAVLGDEAVTDKSDDYIEARFDTLAEKATADPVRTALAGQDRSTVNDNGQAEYENRITNAWKGQKEAS